MSSDKGGHWYTRARESLHEVPNKSKPGEMRGTTLRDARTLGLFPSVTTILSVLDRPQLTDWKLEQVAAAAYALVSIPKLTHPTVEDWTKFILEKAFQQTTDAADLGTAIHAAIEAWATGQPYDAELAPYVQAVAEWVKKEQIEFVTHEEIVVSEEHGHAGTLDASIRCPRGRGILDFKSRKTKPGIAATPYDTQPMQVAAYHVAKFGTDSFWPDAVGVNLFISTTERDERGLARIDATWYSAAELQSEWRAFSHALSLWKHIKGYDATEAAQPAAPKPAKHAKK